MAYWQPTKRMRAQGFGARALGSDGDGARAEAASLNEEWQAFRVAHDADAACRTARAIGFVYFIRTTGDLIKIGFTRDPSRRLRKVLQGVGDRLDTFVCVTGSLAAEKRLHADLKAHATRGEWYRCCGPVLRAMSEAASLGIIEPRGTAPNPNISWNASNSEQPVPS